MKHYASLEPKPKYRGWLHALFVPPVLVFAYFLLAACKSNRAIAANVVFLLTIALCYSVSAIYHLAPVGLTWERRLRKLDHTCIYLAIAGAYTPIAVLVLSYEMGTLVLYLAWMLAAFGIVRVHALTLDDHLADRGGVGVYALIQFIGAITVLQIVCLLPHLVVACLVVSWACLLAGTAVYGYHWPDPWPETFGYHEVFHALTIAAEVSTCVAVYYVTSTAS